MKSVVPVKTVSALNVCWTWTILMIEFLLRLLWPKQTTSPQSKWANTWQWVSTRIHSATTMIALLSEIKINLTQTWKGNRETKATKRARQDTLPSRVTTLSNPLTPSPTTVSDKGRNKVSTMRLTHLTATRASTLWALSAGSVNHTCTITSRRTTTPPRADWTKSSSIVSWPMTAGTV